MKKNEAPPEEPRANQNKAGETPFETLAGYCVFVVVWLFATTLVAQNMVIPSGSMEKTLLVGDHLMVDHITLAAPMQWMPLVHYREPQRGDIVVFKKPVPDLDADGNPQYMTLVKRLIGVPGDHIRLHNGIVSINGVAQEQPHAEPTTPDNHRNFLDEFPSVPPSTEMGATEAWSVDFPNHIENGDLVVPPGKYFMMGDNRHNSLDSRFWGLLPRENILGRPLFNYWSFVTPDGQLEDPGIGDSMAWMGHVALHFFTETRWSRTLHPVR
jgi:signal peptidase I